MDVKILRVLLQKNKATVIRIDYTGADGNRSVRLIKPYELKDENKVSYLYASEMQKDDSAIRKFRVDRIKTAAPLSLKFIPVWEIKV